MENNDADKKETDDSTTQRRRKPELKFAPKVLPKKTPKIILKREPHENKVLTIDRKVMTGIGSFKITDNPRNGAKAEKQGTPVQVSFGRADPSVPRTFPTPRSSSTGVALVKLFKEHDEPWDYKCTNYPITLPLRWRNSGDTENLDEEQFSHSLSRAQDGELTAVEELGLMERVDMPQLLFFQFPTSLPLPRETDPAAEEVAAGSNCMFAQEVVAIDTREKHCSSMGEFGK